jgi:ABC-2 type transport system ATP-binding protein
VRFVPFVRLAFAVAIHTELDILLVDEVLAVGDAPFRQKCTTKIRELAEARKTMLVVSHDLGMVGDLCTRGIVIRRGRMIFDGPVDDAIRSLKETR